MQTEKVLTFSAYTPKKSFMERLIAPSISSDLNRKMVILSGPRQCGKTYLAKNQIGKNVEYLNFDVPAHQKAILSRSWNRNPEIVVFDEIHKLKKWKQWLKGIIDDSNESQKILVTGSAKMDIYKKVGDSLAGRFFSYHLYPFDLKEILNDSKNNLKPNQILDRLLLLSGFAEPYLNGKISFYNKWKDNHLDVILKQDILELESIKSIKQLEILMHLLPARVGSLLSYNSLSKDLRTDDKSVQRWIDILERSYAVFRIYPYLPRGIANAIKKAPKIYFFDIARVEDSAIRLENLVALSLLKEIHYRKDCLGEIYNLHFVRNKQHQEIDFLITKNKVPHLLIEVKQSGSAESENFKAFAKYFPKVEKIQLVQNLTKPFKTKNQVKILPMADWLAKMNF